MPIDKELVCKKIAMPESIAEFLDLLYTKFDQMILSRTDEEGYVTEALRPSWLEHLYRRGVLNQKTLPDGSRRYAAASVNDRLEAFIVVEKAYWLSLPRDVRDAINDRYIMNPHIWLPRHIASGKQGQETVLPLEQCIRIIEARYTGFGYLAECNCNNYIGGCDRDKFQICVHFPKQAAPANSPDGRGLSKRATKEELIAAMSHADRQGLIHKMGSQGRNFCNCCTCCCIHHHNAKEYEADLRSAFLSTPYLAVVDENRCVGCGACTAMCPFSLPKIQDGHAMVDPEHCWGCGVCRQACPTEAIQVFLRKNTVDQDG